MRERERKREQSKASGRVQSRERSRLSMASRLNMARLSVREEDSRASRLENMWRSRSGKSTQRNSRLQGEGADRRGKPI